MRDAVKLLLQWATGLNPEGQIWETERNTNLGGERVGKCTAPQRVNG